MPPVGLLAGAASAVPSAGLLTRGACAMPPVGLPTGAACAVPSAGLLLASEFTRVVKVATGEGSFRPLPMASGCSPLLPIGGEGVPAMRLGSLLVARFLGESFSQAFRIHELMLTYMPRW